MDRRQARTDYLYRLYPVLQNVDIDTLKILEKEFQKRKMQTLSITQLSEKDEIINIVAQIQGVKEFVSQIERDLKESTLVVDTARNNPLGGQSFDV